MRKTATSNQIFIDPVCSMKVDPGDKNLMFTNKLRTYYFCAETCRKAFAADPDNTFSFVYFTVTSHLFY